MHTIVEKPLHGKRVYKQNKILLCKDNEHVHISVGINACTWFGCVNLEYPIMRAKLALDAYLLNHPIADSLQLLTIEHLLTRLIICSREWASFVT